MDSSKKCIAIVSRPREADVVRRCGKDAVDGGAYCERHRHDPRTAERQAQWAAVLRPDWDVQLGRIHDRAERERERRAREQERTT